MKKWSILIVMLLVCLTGCGREDVILSRPHALEVTCGEQSVFAMSGGYEWNWKEGRELQIAVSDAMDPRSAGKQLSYLVAQEGQPIVLNFAKAPNKLLAERFSAGNGYAAGEFVEITDMTVPAPADGGDYLYSVTATWDPGKGVDSWGSCTYHFRFLEKAVPGAIPEALPDVGDLSLQEVLQMDAGQFMGMEFANHVAGQAKTCRTSRDKEAILAFFRGSLAADFSASLPSAAEPLYAIRMVALDGSQLTVSYGKTGMNNCIMAGGVAYPCEEMDFEPLWTELQAGAVSAAAAASGKGYLDMTDAFPGDNWGNEFVYAYLKDLGETASYDEMRWIEDPAMPDGYRLEKGWADQSMPISADCEYWILENGKTPYCKVSSNRLMTREEEDILYRIYMKDGAVIAVCEQNIP